MWYHFDHSTVSLIFETCALKLCKRLQYDVLWISYIFKTHTAVFHPVYIITPLTNWFIGLLGRIALNLKQFIYSTRGAGPPRSVNLRIFFSALMAVVLFRYSQTKRENLSGSRSNTPNCKDKNNINVITISKLCSQMKSRGNYNMLFEYANTFKINTPYTRWWGLNLLRNNAPHLP